MKNMHLTALAVVACAGVVCAATEGKLLGSPEAATGLNSFTVEGLVKTPEIHYFNFAGTRTPAPWYNTKGWCLGMTKTGRFSAVIGDGTNRAYTWWELIRTPWEPGEWNHVAMTRDAEAGTLVVYVNGEKCPNETRYVVNTRPSKTPVPIDVTTTGTPHVGGRDAMTGSDFRGEIGDFTVTKGVLSGETVAAHAKAALAGLAKDTSVSIAAAPVTVASALPCAPVPLELTPRPKSLTVSPAAVAISGRWTATGLDGRGLATLAERLTLDCGMTNAPGGVRLAFADAKGAHPEEFAIRGGVAADGAYEIAVTADGAVRYAAMDAIGQLLRLTSLANGRTLSAPKSFAITDWPSMPVRMAITPFAQLWDNDTFEQRVREIAFMRMNAVHLSTGKIPQKRLETWCRTCSDYGIDTISWISYLLADPKHPFSPLDAESMAALKAWIEKDCTAGVKGFTMAFDDLTGPYIAVSGRPAEKERYGSMGALHNAVVAKAREFAAPHPIRTWLAIPFLYGVFSQQQAAKPGETYFRDFTKGFRDAGVTMLHTGFSGLAVDQLRAAGAETYGYYVNGTWPTELFFTWYMGMERLAWTWNMFYCDRNGNGPVPYEDMLAEMRTLDRRSRVFFGASSSTVSRYMAGWIPWNPAGWDERAGGRALAQRFYGTGAYEALDRYAHAVAPMVGYFMTYKTSWTVEAKAPDSARMAPLTKSEFLGYWRNLGQAKEARAELAAAFAAQKTVFDRAAAPVAQAARGQKLVLADIDKSIGEIEQKLRFLAKRKNISLGERKIMSFNVRHCAGMDHKVDVERTAARIRAENPDFVCLQEIDVGTGRAGMADQSAELARLTGLHATFAKAIAFDGGEYGVALLSRERPLRTVKTPLPGAEPRVLLICEFPDFAVGTTHLSCSAEAERAESIALVEKAVASFAAVKPVFLAGDWNSTPDSPVLAGLGRFLKVLSRTDGQTYHGSRQCGPDKQPLDMSRFCIDYIACDRAHADAFAVADARIIPDRATSDHAPIVVTLSARPSSGTGRFCGRVAASP